MPLGPGIRPRPIPGLASPWAFIDNAGGSQVLAGVADRVRDFLLTTPVQHGASYEPSQRGSAQGCGGHGQDRRR